MGNTVVQWLALSHPSLGVYMFSPCLCGINTKVREDE